MSLNKLVLLISLSSIMAACGQKGDLIVDRPAGQTQTQQAETDITENESTSISRQVEGSSTIINR